MDLSWEAARIEVECWVGFGKDERERVWSGSCHWDVAQMELAVVWGKFNHPKRLAQPPKVGCARNKDRKPTGQGIMRRQCVQKQMLGATLSPSSAAWWRLPCYIPCSHAEAKGTGCSHHLPYTEVAGKDGRGKMGEERRDVFREQRRKEASSRKQPERDRESQQESFSQWWVALWFF